MDEVYKNLPTPAFTDEEKELISSNVYAHVWRQAIGGHFARVG